MTTKRDPIAEAADELRALVLANGFSQELITEIAQEYDVSELAVRNRFKLTFGKYPDELAAIAAEQHVGPVKARERAKAYAKERGNDPDYVGWVGRRFRYEDRFYLFAHRSKPFTYAAGIQSGKLYRFNDTVWRSIIKPQLDIPETRHGRSDPNVMSVAAAAERAEELARKAGARLELADKVGLPFMESRETYVFAGAWDGCYWGVALRGGRCLGFSDRHWTRYIAPQLGC